MMVTSQNYIKIHLMFSISKTFIVVPSWHCLNTQMLKVPNWHCCQSHRAHGSSQNSLILPIRCCPVSETRSSFFHFISTEVSPACPLQQRALVSFLLGERWLEKNILTITLYKQLQVRDKIFLVA